MNLYENELYIEDVHFVAGLDLPWNKLKDKRIVLSGATGMIGSFFADVVLEKNYNDGLGCIIYAISRDMEAAKKRFNKYADSPYLCFIPYDVNFPLIREDLGEIEYVFHLASNTHPLQYAVDPIGTITANIIGLRNMLDFSVAHHTKRFVFASSNEIYGENRGDVELFTEDYCGYINSNTLRAGYPESKRCGEALCQAYKMQKQVDVVIPRFTRTYGPTMLRTDTKAVSQFIKKSVAGDNIVLKSTGRQFFSYQYVADSVSGLLYTVLLGESGEAYNIADKSGDILLKDLASLAAAMNGKEIVFEIPDAIEASGYSTATKARLSGEKLAKLGWRPKYDIKKGIERTITILRKVWS